MRQIGSNMTCKIKFRGRIAVDKATFPFAMPVKIRYQSVHGVTISIINPIYSDGLSPKNTIASSHARMGVQTKFMRIEVYVNFMFLKAILISSIGICKKVIYSIATNKGTIKLSALALINSACPILIPKITAKNIITVYNFSIKFNLTHSL
jgi:hypothetical protein